MPCTLPLLTVAGMTFVTLARILGVQKSAAALPEPVPAVKEDVSTKSKSKKGK